MLRSLQPLGGLLKRWLCTKRDKPREPRLCPYPLLSSASKVGVSLSHSERSSPLSPPSSSKLEFRNFAWEGKQPIKQILNSSSQRNCLNLQQSIEKFSLRALSRTAVAVAKLGREARYRLNGRLVFRREPGNKTTERNLVGVRINIEHWHQNLFFQRSHNLIALICRAIYAPGPLSTSTTNTPV